MKTTKFIALAILLTGGLSMFLTSCSEDTVTEVEKINGCMNAAAINYNANATNDDGTCILADQLDDTTRTIYTAAQHAADAALKPWHDHTHSNLYWETDYKDLGYSTLTGRFVEFDLTEPMVFNEKTPSLTHFKAWAQISSIFTGETGRDNANTGCMPRDLGVRWYTHEEISGTDTTVVQDSIVENSDFAYLETTLGACEFYYSTSKRGFTTSYRVPAKLKFKEQSTATDNGPLYQGDVMVYFNYNGMDYESGRSGFQGYFKFNRNDYGVTATSPGEEMTINFNIQVRLK